MSHDPSKILLGTVQSSIREIGNKKGTILAGRAVRLKSDGGISSASADGSLIGISVGRDLSNAGHTSYALRGAGVPLELEASFTPVQGAVVHLSNTTGKGAAAGAGATATAAVYASGLKSGIPEGGGAEVPAAYIDFAGGL